MEVESNTTEFTSPTCSFDSFNLDARLVKVLSKQNIAIPTLIQEKAIPLALEGKDLLAKAKTGSGKTLSYLLPILQNLLSDNNTSVAAMILVPTKELAKQVSETCKELMYYFPKTITCLNLAGEESLQLQKSLLSSNPTVLVTTPSRILPHLDSKALNLMDSLKFLVIDEADLVLSFGYAQDLTRLVEEFIPKTVQTFLMSATLSTEMEALKQLVLRNPVILKLHDGEDEGEEGQKLQQFVIRCEKDDKYLLMYVTLKMKLLKGKLLVFANDIEVCFRLKLFLEQFGVKTCLLNAELPLASRHHIVDEFNRGVYDIIIASDLQDAGNGNDKKKGKNSFKRKRMVKGKSDKEGGVARGVDFKRVDVVINFELPQQVDSYIHRVGRTARGGESGTAISFISSTSDETMLKAIIADQERRGTSIQSHDFDLSQLDGFRYRCSDALRSVTKAAIKTARLQCAKEEILKSDKLKTFFEDRPNDLSLLRHDRNTGAVKARPHLKHVPDYLLATNSSKPSTANTDGIEGSKRARLDPLPQMQRDPSTKRKFIQRKKKTTSFPNSKKNRDPLKNIKRK